MFVSAFFENQNSSGFRRRHQSEKEALTYAEGNLNEGGFLGQSFAFVYEEQDGEPVEFSHTTLRLMCDGSIWHYR